ncbi:DUF6418 domain-containing protein [Reichenbachiella sp. MALMAid0571]|uniref:DUF6418 domain-containing protein n=1 Tax=Reichenbachiella sp. MALMAid0571 TaxID=3143939 RepID=UPI0032E00FAD
MSKLRAHVFPLLYLIIISSWILSSVYALDFGGTYIFELRITSFESLATSALVLCNIVFFEGVFSYLVKKNYYLTPEVKKPLILPKHLQLLGYITNILILVMYGSFFFTGVPLLSGMDRASYWNMISGVPIINFVLGNYLLISFLVGLKYAYMKKLGKDVRWSIFQLISIILFFILAGNKFSALFSIITNFLVSPTFLGVFDTISFKRLLKIGFAIIGFFLITILIQSNTYGLSSEAYGEYKIFSYLFQRVFVLQGEIWWKTFQDVIMEGNFNGSHFQEELNAILFNNLEPYTGLKYLMVEAANGDFIYEILEGNYLYTGAFPAIIIATFSKILVFPVLFALGRFLAILLLTFKELHYKRSFLRIYLIYVLYSTCLSMILGGTFGNFFMMTNLLRVLMLMGIALLIYDGYKKINSQTDFQ